jgi:haloalkane dehalogenase
VHLVDEGRPNASETVVCLHGEPSWSFLYRKVIPVLAESGHRVVVPDLVGFGRSDKPTARADHTYARHVEWLRAALFDELGLGDLTLVCQDWGGLLGLRLVAEHPDRFRRVVAANTGLPTGEERMSDAFFAWQRFSQEVPELPVGRIVRGGTVLGLAKEVVAAYDAPFPDERFKEGPRQMPALVPTRPDDPAAEANRRAWASLRDFDRPFLCAFSDGDPITAGAERQFVEAVPGAAGLDHVTIAGAGHFLQEDKGEELAAVVAAFISSTPPAAA